MTHAPQHDTSGKPLIHLYSKAQNQANDLDLNNLAICLSHSKEYAIACATGKAE